MKILISGSGGLVGSALVQDLLSEGHEIGRLVRRTADRSRNEIYWDPERGSLDKEALQDFHPEAVIHLAGESIAQGRWNVAKKAKIRDSRVNGTRVLAQVLTHLSDPPKIWVCASAIGYYGNRGDETLTEDSPPGRGFLPEVCRDWEAATEPARSKGIRVVQLRFGVILSPEGGALKKMLLPFKLGLGGVIGNGRQYMSWIALDDAVGVIRFAMENKNLSGVINTVAPQPVTNREFTKTLGRVLFRPTCFPLPASTARLLLGEMAEDLLLASTRVEPKKLKSAGYAFQYPELKGALRHLLK
jgi:uncharacterized protein (TIGR01777 family)